MEKTFLEICNDVASNNGYYPIMSLSLLDDYVQRIKRYVNEGYKVCWKAVFQDLKFQRDGKFTIACDRQFTTMTAFDSLLIEGHELKYLPLRDFKRIRSAERKKLRQRQILRRPEFFTLWEKELHFFPHPDRCYDVDFIGHVKYAPLEVDEDVPQVDSDVLIAYGDYKMRSFHNQQTDTTLHQVFEKHLATYIDSLVNPTKTQLKAPTMQVNINGNTYR